MTRSLPPSLAAGVLLAFSLGCATPADDAPDAVVEEAAATPAQDAPEEPVGTVYALSAESKIGFVGSKVTGSHVI